MTLPLPIGHPMASASRWCGPDRDFSSSNFPLATSCTRPQAAIGDPRISPKGDLIAFLDQPLGSSGTLGSVATVDLKGNKKTLTQFWLGSLTGLAWSSSGDEILFAASAYAVASSLYAVNPSGRQRLIAHLPGTFSMLDVAPDGRLLMGRLVLSTAMFYQPTLDSKETDLYWHDLSWVSDISRDGKALLFSEGGDATRSGEDYVTYLRRTDGSAAVRLGPGFPLEISPDGKWAMVLGSSRAPSQLVFAAHWNRRSAATDPRWNPSPRRCLDARWQADRIRGK